jgi:hypothetical protein
MNQNKIDRMVAAWKKENPPVIITWKAGKDGSIVDWMKSGKVILPHNKYPKPKVGDTTEVILDERATFVLAVPYDIAENTEYNRIKALG